MGIQLWEICCSDTKLGGSFQIKGHLAGEHRPGKRSPLPPTSPHRGQKRKIQCCQLRNLRVNSNRILLREAAHVLNLEANINEQSAGMV